MLFHQRQRRGGTILPYLAISVTALCGFVALAVDLGQVAVARTQVQNAADAAAMAAARSIDGSASPNLTQATANAQATAAANKVLGDTLQASEVVVQHGAYHYDQASQTFTPQYPPVAPDNYCCSQVTITHSHPTSFARIFGYTAFTVSATATAAHRPRDVVVILDFSGSMNDESSLWATASYIGTAANASNNIEGVFPQFGHYSNTAAAALQCTSTDPRVGKCNLTMSVLGIPALVNDFYQNPRNSLPPVNAFTSKPDSQATVPGGDNYMPRSGQSIPNYATTIQDITGATNAQVTAKTDPAMPSYTNFKGYTEGPRYWGRTFFIWPPDPSASNDWRQKFFLKGGGSYPTFGGAVNDNTLLWDSSGNWLPPISGSTTNYVINYKAILAWISAQNIFPPILRGGKVTYYTAIPTDVPQACYNWNNYGNNITYNNNNERFWKEYIDYALGVWRSPYSIQQTPGTLGCSYGGDYVWGTVKISKPVTYSTAPTTRVHPQDNPQRPRHRMWFGPMTLIQFLLDAGLMPGTAHDIQMYSAKSGIQAALVDIQNNHPNDEVAMLIFNRPPFPGEPSDAGRFSMPVVNLSRNYTALQNALWFPPNSSTQDVMLWDTNDHQTPRAHSDYIYDTTTNYGFMQAYNQLSSSTVLQAKGTGGYGRVGADRIVILMTDGMANAQAVAGFTAVNSGGSGLSYFNINPGDTVTSGSDPTGSTTTAVTKICALTTDTTNGPGFATARKPVQVQCLAFGAIFEPTASGSQGATALSLLQQISTIGGTGFPSSVTDTGPYAYKLCTGTAAQRQQKLQTAFSIILDQTVSVSLIQ